MTLEPRFDAVVHAPNRLQVCAILASVDDAEFPVLRDALGVSDSVLSKHLKVLEEAGYLTISKATSESRVRSRVALTTAGRGAFSGHLAELHRLASADPAELLRPR